MNVSNWVSVVLALLAVLSLVVAWHQWREVVRRRHVDMFWRIFDAYNSDELRDSRDAFFEIEERLQLPRPSGRTDRITDGATLREYSTKYWREFYEGDPDHQRLDRLARARVRFYAQTGALLKKRLVDKDLLFGLIGPPLDVDMRLLDVVIHANRERHGFLEMFEEVEYADGEYQRWRQSRGRRTRRHRMADADAAPRVIDETTIRALFGRFNNREAFFADPEGTWIDRPHYHVLAQNLEMHTRDEVVAWFRRFFDAVPDLQMEVEDVAVAGEPGRERVTVRWRFTGTFSGAPYLGIEPTGRRLDLRGMDLIDIEDGRVAGNHIYYDQLTFARQIGMLPPEGSAGDRLMTSAFNFVTKGRAAIRQATDTDRRPLVFPRTRAVPIARRRGLR